LVLDRNEDELWRYGASVRPTRLKARDYGLWQVTGQVTRPTTNVFLATPIMHACGPWRSDSKIMIVTIPFALFTEGNPLGRRADHGDDGPASFPFGRLYTERRVKDEANRPSNAASRSL